MIIINLQRNPHDPNTTTTNQLVMMRLSLASLRSRCAAIQIGFEAALAKSFLTDARPGAEAGAAGVGADTSGFDVGVGVVVVVCGVGRSVGAGTEIRTGGDAGAGAGAAGRSDGGDGGDGVGGLGRTAVR